MSRAFSQIDPLPPKSSDVCAKLMTTRNGRREGFETDQRDGPVLPAIFLKPYEGSSYIVAENIISAVHCKIYAVRSPSGGVIVSCQDVSRNGITLNGQPIKKCAIIVMHGDVIGLPNLQTFTCLHMTRGTPERTSLFDPTQPNTQTPQRRRIGRYEVMSHCLGSGSFATVHLAFDPMNHKQVACKSIKTKRDHEIKTVMKEVRILMTLKHPNINEIHDTEESDGFIHIFLQLCTGGDLFTYISTSSSRNYHLCEAEAKYIMFQLLKALEYLHARHIAHRDLKPENILLYAPGPYPRILIADFGLARPNSYQETLNVCGTVSYLPPEGILALDNKHLGYVGMPADCWSAGVILYIMMCGSHPFDNGSLHEPSCYWHESLSDDEESQYYSQLGTQDRLKERIVDGRVDFGYYPWHDLPEVRSLVEALLRQDPAQRATVERALQHHWIASELEDLVQVYTQRILH